MNLSTILNDPKDSYDVKKLFSDYFVPPEPPESMKVEEGSSGNEEPTIPGRKMDSHSLPGLVRPKRGPHPVRKYDFEEECPTMRKVEIEQGDGTPLGQIPKISGRIDRLKSSDKLLVLLHKLLFRRAGARAEVKRHIRQFSGFVSRDEKEETRFYERLKKWETEDLCELSKLLGLTETVTREILLDQTIQFLKRPIDSEATIQSVSAPIQNGYISMDNAESQNGENMQLAKPRTHRKKTAREVFFQKNRPSYKAKPENMYATRKDIDKQLQTTWDSLNPQEQEEYENLAEAATVLRTLNETIAERLASENSQQQTTETDAEIVDAASILFSMNSDGISIINSSQTSIQNDVAEVANILQAISEQPMASLRDVIKILLVAFN
ncbi:11612_t:CDS:2 [Paraglomus brasilianum]|uniref:11612_t:CDS:1 n=1 Tax=Paraglomus brasilianum TaxID=144538 RepID=A0A9N8WDA6_9GLOM|nr:11612_t:CDS:2 [Paraglomus brasilianum]